MLNEKKINKLINKKLKQQKKLLLKLHNSPVLKLKSKRKIHKRKKIKNSSEYRDYLKSKHWIKRRAKYWRSHERTCFCCRKYASDLHHRTYCRLGKEIDDDFIPLCRECHYGIHRLVKNKGIELLIAHKIYKKFLNTKKRNA